MGKVWLYNNTITTIQLLTRCGSPHINGPISSTSFRYVCVYVCVYVGMYVGMYTYVCTIYIIYVHGDVS